MEMVSLAKEGIKISGEQPAKESEPWCSATQNRCIPIESQNLASSMVSLIAEFAFVFEKIGDWSTALIFTF